MWTREVKGIDGRCQPPHKKYQLAGGNGLTVIIFSRWWQHIHAKPKIFFVEEHTYHVVDSTFHRKQALLIWTFFFWSRSQHKFPPAHRYPVGVYNLPIGGDAQIHRPNGCYISRVLLLEPETRTENCCQHLRDILRRLSNIRMVGSHDGSA